MSKPPAKLHLRIDSHVVIQLGAELISDSEQALLELVKNAYDGDATKCVISIEPNWDPDVSHPWREHLDALTNVEPGRDHVGRIVVMDNGTGLTPTAVDDGWLFISASLKRSSSGTKNRTTLQRIPVGDKGLGRLATMRLGDVLFLRTMTAGERSVRAISFAWSSFSSGASLEDIDVKVTRESVFKGRAHGTNVEILGLTEPSYWNRESNINGVISKLSTLISPFDAFKDFQVNVRSGEQEHDLQAISAEALNFASSKFEFKYENKKLTLKAFIGKSLFRGTSGQENRKLFEQLLADDQAGAVTEFFSQHSRIKNRGFQNLVGKPGGWLFSLEEELPWDDIPKDPRLSGASDPGPFNGEIYNFLFNDHTKEQLVAANVPLGLLQGMTTIGMFRDRFRVRMNDDWLELAKGVTSGGFFQLRPRNVIGYFSISNELNSKLVEKSDREGFVDNESWRGFMLLAFRTRKFANDSLDAVRTAFDEYKKRQATERDIPTETAREANIRMSAQKNKTSASLQSLMTKSSSVSDQVEKARKKIVELNVGENANASYASIAKELQQVGEQLQAVRGTVASVEATTREGFSAASSVALAHEQLEEQNLRLIDAAAVGLSARALTHEINDHMTRLSRGLSVISRANKTHQDKKIDAAIESISGVIRELKKSVATIDPLLAGSRSLKDIFDIDIAISSFFKARESRLAEQKISFNIQNKASIKINFSKVRFSQILDNLLQNSIFWINEHSASDKSLERAIYVQTDELGFTWYDGGKGIRETVEDTIFDAYVTDKPESKGQGLGLFIISAYLHAEKCNAYLLPDRNSFGRRYKFRVDLAGASKK